MAHSIHGKNQFRAGDVASGEALLVADVRLETVEFCKVSQHLSVIGSIAIAETSE